MPTYGPVLLIVFSVFVGILLNRRDHTDLKAEMNRRFDTVEKRIGKLEEDYTTFYGIQQKLEGRVDEVSSRIK